MNNPIRFEQSRSLVGRIQRSIACSYRSSCSKNLTASATIGGRPPMAGSLAALDTADDGVIVAFAPRSEVCKLSGCRGEPENPLLVPPRPQRVPQCVPAVQKRCAGAGRPCVRYVAFLASARNGTVLAFHAGASVRDRRRSCHGRSARTHVQPEKAQVGRKASAGIADRRNRVVGMGPRWHGTACGQ